MLINVHFEYNNSFKKAMGLSIVFTCKNGNRGKAKSRFYPALFYPDFIRRLSRNVADDIIKAI